MFRIKKIILYKDDSIKKEYGFEDINYIYGPNNKGKTVLYKTLDFLLGSSDNVLRDNLEGLDNINRLGIVISNNHKEVELLRDANHFFVRHDLKGEYSLVDADTYKSHINDLLEINSAEVLDSYYRINDEHLSYRSLSFLNFLDESGIGNISTVFSRANQKKFIFKVKDIMDFIFKYEYLEKRVNKEREIEELESKIKTLNTKYLNIENALTCVKSVFSKYNIPHSNSFDDNYEQYQKMKISFSETITTSPKKYDLFRLLEMLNKIDNQIVTERQMKNQSSTIVDKNTKVNSLLNDFNHILGGNPNFIAYTKIISETLEKNQYVNSVINAKNYDASINNLIEKKKEIKSKIGTIKNELAGFSIEEKMLDLSKLQEAFEILNVNDYVEINSVESDLRDAKKKLKAINKKIKEHINDSINEIITDMYVNSDKSIDFILEDKQKDSFKVLFDTSRLSLSCYYKKHSQGNSIEQFFIPGSLARMTTLQVATYLSVFKYISDKKMRLPIMPLLCVDGLSQPFDDVNDQANYKNVVKLLVKYAKECNVQLIIISIHSYDDIKSHLCDNEVKEIDLTSGFNPWHC